MDFVELERLGQYAENISANLSLSRQTSAKKIRRILSGKLSALKAVTDMISEYHPTSGRLPKEFEWLCDNRYIAEREGRGAILMLRRAGKLPGPRQGYPKVFGLATALVESGNGEVSSERIRAFITGAQKAGAFSEKELWLFIVMLKAALILDLQELAQLFKPMLQEYTGSAKGIFSAELELERIRSEGGRPPEETAKLAEKAADIHTEYAQKAERIFTSLRLLSNTDFRELMYQLSSVESILLRDPAGVYPHMDEDSRSQYRRVVSRLAKRLKSSEASAAEQAIHLSEQAADPRQRHVGYYLLTQPLGKPSPKWAGPLYFSALMAATLLLTLLVWPIAGPIATLLLILPLSDVAKNLCDTFTLKLRHPTRLPRLELKDGLPPEAKTLCIISALLTNENAGSKYASLLEQYMLANRNAGPQLLFGVLADLKDADRETTEQDAAILNAMKSAIAKLNETYGNRFFFLIRKRTLNRAEQRYMSWERKRGALIELSRYLLGKTSGMRVESGDPIALNSIKYVITLDSDTRLTIGSASELVGTMLHPLNRPYVDPSLRIVTEGHALLQPRVSVDLEAASRSFFSRAFAGLGGTDPYGSTISDLYQDLFDQGSFTGKGIFDVEIFSQCLDHRFPENRILSHDLLEGCYLRSGLVSDVELTDGYPHKVSSYFARLHRWTRGDWQIMPWLLRKVPIDQGSKESNPLSGLSKWKIFDNLRRSLVPLFTFAALLWGMLFDGLWAATGVAVAISLSSLALSAASALLRGGYELGSRYHSSILYGVRGSAAQTLIQLALLPYHAVVSLHAILTALYRMGISKKKLLQWVTAEQSEHLSANGVAGMYRMMSPSVLLGIAAIFLSDFILAKVLGALWILSPLLSSIISKPTIEEKTISETDRAFLRRQAGLMWQYFDTFLDESNNYLPPDNFQEQPAVGVARRTSPTNIGLALLCCLAAHDLKLASLNHVLDLIERMLSTIERLEKWHGHPMNWYETSTLKPLYPLSVSSVDSGNLAACYIALIEGLKSQAVPRALELADRARALLDQMDFVPLYDKSRKMFYISLDVETEQPSESWYDLLASEARQTSYLCIARGIIDKKHWRRLGRALVQKNGYSGMASWTGTMFEYLMPNLLLPTYKNSLIYESLRFCVYCHKLRGAAFKIPWGISESAYFAFDRSLNYQYKAHGVQRLAFKRGMNRELVVSPYSSFLALEVEPAAATKNLRRLKDIGLEGRFGLYETADFTPNRLVSGLPFESVQCFMAHHIGMSLVACDNLLNDRVMQRRFMADPQMAAYAELLQERTPVDAVTVRSSLSEVPEKPRRSIENEWSLALVGYDAFQPRCHIVSNGSYTLFLTNTGLSYSMSDGLMLTRFDASLTEGVSGIYFFLRIGDTMISLSPAPFFDANVHYSSEFDERGGRLYASYQNIKTCITACVPNRDKAELREVKIRVTAPTEGELICYFEPILSKAADFSAHPAFSKLFLETSAEDSGILIHRRPRSDGENIYGAFFCSDKEVQYNTSREKALGRGGFSKIRSLSKHIQPFVGGSVLDPCLLARIPIRMQAGESKTIRYALSVAGSMDGAISAAERTLRLSYRQASSRPVSESHTLSLTQPEVTSALDLLREITFLTPGRRNFAKHILENTHGQSELWKYGISGDLPIITAICQTDTAPDIISRTIRQHRLLVLGGARCDLVLLFSDGGDYRRPVRTAAVDLIRSIGAENILGAPGGIHLLDLLPTDADFSLIAACSSALIDAKGEPIMLAKADAQKPEQPQRLLAEPKSVVDPVTEADFAPEADVEYLDGGAIRFQAGGQIPACTWSNVLANEQLGFIATDSGSGYFWRLNARENRINAWNNDPLALTGDEQISLRLGDKTVSVFASDDHFPCTVTYGPGYASWEKQLRTGKVTTTAFIHPSQPCRLMKVAYEGDENPELVYFTGLILGDRPEVRRHVITAEEHGSIYAFNRYNTAFGNQSILFSSSPAYKSFTCDRTDVLSGTLRGTYGAGLDPCVCLRIPLHEKSAILLIAADRDGVDMRKYLPLMEIEAFHRDLEENIQYWREMVSPIQIETPSPHLNHYINSWALYQTIACRILARSSLYQSGGAYGFRDQLQDSCAALLADPELTKQQILRAAAHQFLEGDVQHWWHPEDNCDTPEKGVRTKCSDDLLWLPYTVCEYIEKTGDSSILDLDAPFLSSDPLKANEHERYEHPRRADETACIYEHCIRAIELVMKRGEGEHGLCLIGTGDWNDGFNLVGAKGRGESVWLTWFFSIVLKRFVPLCEGKGDSDRVSRYTSYCEKLLRAAEEAWDGSWYRRGYFDNGAPLGSQESDECKIDSIAQSFSVLAGADRERSHRAMESALNMLVDREARLARLFWPSFKNSRQNPGYIKGYLDGVRENGGQYTHAAIWLAMSFLELGLYEEGYEILDLLLPSTHNPDIYRVEPYVLAADVYTAENHVGRGGWSWYTGSASWYYRVACENLLGIHITNQCLRLDPKIPSDWDSFKATIRFMQSRWEVEVVRGDVPELLIDGVKADPDSLIPQGTHSIRLILPPYSRNASKSTTDIVERTEAIHAH